MCEIKKSKRKKKVCVVTWYNSMNYGTCLQCVALTQVLEKMELYVYIPEKMNYYNFVEPVDILRRVMRKVKNHIKPNNSLKKFEDMSDDLKNDFQIRKKKIGNFINDKLNIYKMQNKDCFKSLNNDMDAFITGSDQIWNPHYITIFNLLGFVNDEKLKIAYGSSIGVNRIVGPIRRMYSKYLSRFSAIGVREITAQKEIASIVNFEVNVVLDPTFLLDKNEWLLIAQNSIISKDIKIRKKYILCYFIGGNQEWYDSIQKFANLNDLEIIIILSESYLIPNIGISYAGAGIEDFIWLILHAEYIITDSFHATALSINFEKEVIVYKRFKDGEKNSQNSRIDDLLNMFHLNDRLVTEENPINKILPLHINYEEVSKVLEEERKRSKSFLYNSLHIKE